MQRRWGGLLPPLCLPQPNWSAARASALKQACEQPLIEEQARCRAAGRQ